MALNELFHWIMEDILFIQFQHRLLEEQRKIVELVQKAIIKMISYLILDKPYLGRLRTEE
jgi:hypothetical protein